MSDTSILVGNLKQAGQDHEWYPTTQAMINRIATRLPIDAKSVMDIGAGDGRVLKAFAEKCKDAKLYAIELSVILVQAQPRNIIPVGTNVFEQNLSSLPVEYAFCNPPYSEYEDWVCKIIAECFANKVFLVIPQRWKESKLIEKAIKARGATTQVIHSDDFLHGDRSARAVIDIVQVSFPRSEYGNKPKDPFDIWFDENIDTFDRAKEFKESETRQDLARQFAESNIHEMAEAYRAEYKLLEDNYRAIFKLDYMILHELGVNKEHVRDGLKLKMAGLKTKYWQILFDRLDAITSRLATKAKKNLLEKLTGNAAVEFTETNAYAVVLWAIKNANQYFDDQLVDLFMELSQFDNVRKYASNQKTWIADGWRYGNRDRMNTHYKLDYRIVYEGYTAIVQEDEWNKYDYPGGLYKDRHNLISDVRAVLSNLGFSSDSTHSKNRHWVGGKWQDFHRSGTSDVLFQVKAYMNGNMHFRFMPDAIMALNIEAGRLLKWVRTEAEVVEEMGYTPEQAKTYFKRNTQLLPNNVALLAAPAEPAPEPVERQPLPEFTNATQKPLF